MVELPDQSIQTFKSPSTFVGQQFSLMLHTQQILPTARLATAVFSILVYLPPTLWQNPTAFQIPLWLLIFHVFSGLFGIVPFIFLAYSIDQVCLFLIAF